MTCKKFIPVAGLILVILASTVNARSTLRTAEKEAAKVFSGHPFEWECHENYDDSCALPCIVDTDCPSKAWCVGAATNTTGLCLCWPENGGVQCQHERKTEKAILMWAGFGGWFAGPYFWAGMGGTFIAICMIVLAVLNLSGIGAVVTCGLTGFATMALWGFVTFQSYEAKIHDGGDYRFYDSETLILRAFVNGVAFIWVRGVLFFCDPSSGCVAA